jgi:hypothetical protein
MSAARIIASVQIGDLIDAVCSTISLFGSMQCGPKSGKVHRLKTLA